MIEGASHRAPRPVVGLAVALQLLCCSTVALAQRRGPPPAPDDDPTGETRGQAPAPQDGQDADDQQGDGATAGDEGVAAVAAALWRDLSATVEQWYESLEPQTGPLAAWAVLASPVVPLLLFLLLLRRRRSTRPKGAAARGGGPKPGKGKKGDKVPKEKGQKAHKAQKERRAEAASPALELPRTRVVMLGPDGEAPSMFETLLGVGFEEDALDVLSDSARAQLDPTTWAAAVTEGRPGRLRALRRHWVRALVLHRVAGWLRAHPLVADKLTVQVPTDLEPDAVDGLTLTQADGLGAHLDREQQQVLRLARNTLAEALACADNPYELTRLVQGGIKVLLPPSVYAGPVPCYGVALLLGGLGALERLRAASHDVPELDEFRDAIDEHRQLVNAPVPAEGVAVHALVVLGGGKLPGVGTLMASVAGAAYSTSAVLMRVSKLAGEIDKLSAAAVGRVGKLVIDALEDLAAGDGQVLAKNVNELLGLPVLAEEQRRIAELARACERRLARSPLWPPGGAGKSVEELERPDAALLGLYQSLLERAASQAAVAKDRLFEIFAALANAGSDGANLSGAQHRLGFAIVGLGMPLLRGTSTEMLSVAREALASVSTEADQER